MSYEDIQKYIIEIVDKKFDFQWVYIILSGIISLIASNVVTYLRTKSQNLATKQDIREITNESESVKMAYSKELSIANQKRELKYNAILNALILLDGNFSELFKDLGDSVKKQFSTIEEARKVHNELILTCENEEILLVFSKLMFGGSSEPPTELLNKFRNLARKELGFGNEIMLDKDKAWIGSIRFEKNT